MQILVVEDDRLLAHHLASQLGEMDNKVRVAQDAAEARYLVENYLIDVAIIDLGLPDMDGISLIKQLRDTAFEQPILILTARSNWEDKVAGLDAGADDFVVKPFQMPELVARLHALVRRSSGFVKPQIELEGMVLHLNERAVQIDGQPLELTAFEYKILEFMLRHKGAVVSKQKLLELLYDEGEGDLNTIEVLVSRLRKKLTQGGASVPIQTIRGQGYRLGL